MVAKKAILDAATGEDRDKVQAEYNALSDKLAAQNKAYNEFCKSNGLVPQYDRARLADFTREQSDAANAAMKGSGETVEQSTPSEQLTIAESGGIIKASEKVELADVTDGATDVNAIIKISNDELPNGLPINGTPNSIVDKVDENGATLQRRYYGSDGNALKDIDTSDHNRPKSHPMGAHVHEFDYSKKKVRRVARKFTDEELAQNADIVQKGVNYNDDE